MTFGKPKKSLGQNFLIQPNIVAKIIFEARLKKDETVLEVGPGRGALTRALLATGAHVIAVEKDDALFTELHETFAQEIKTEKLLLVRGDILEKNPEDLGLENQRFTVVANIPYYITGELLRRMLSGNIQPRQMTLMVQKEVATRIVAKDGHESLLSLSVKVYGTPRYLATVGKGNFYPVPKVDSAILNIEGISKEFFDKLTVGNLWKREGTSSEQAFFSMLHAGFAHKRKYVMSNLSESAPKDDLIKLFQLCDINKKARAEELSLENWRRLLELGDS